MSLMETAQLLGNFGEFLGSIAVLATLIYLTVQVKQARHQLTMAGMQARANHARGILDPIITSPDLASIFAKLNFIDYGDYGLSREESMKFGAWCHIFMKTEEGNFYNLPEGIHDGIRSWWLSSSAGAEFWEKNKGFYDQPFVEYMEGLKQNLAENPRSPDEIMTGRS